MAKRYYWLKLKETFFTSPQLKAMRNLPGGAELCVIYLKMMLQSIKNNGILLHTLSSNSFSDELALLLDEEKNSIELVLHFLTINHLLEQIEDNSYLLAEAQECIGSESTSAVKMRKKRERDKQIPQISEKSHCDQNVTIEREIDINTDNSNTEIISNSKNLNSNYITPKGDLNYKELAVVVDALNKIDVKENVATELYKEYGKDKILLALKDMQGRKGIYRPGGYLIKMLKDKWPLSKNIIENNIQDELKKQKNVKKEYCKNCIHPNNNDNWLCDRKGKKYNFTTTLWVECEFYKSK